MTAFVAYDAKWGQLEAGFGYSKLDAAPCEGPLSYLHRPTVIRVQGQILLCLSASLGGPPTEVQDVLNALATELLVHMQPNSTHTPLGSLQREIWQLFKDGRFRRTVPDIMAIDVGDGSRVRLWRAGPNGVAMIEKGQVWLLSEDLRIGALRRLGASLDEKWSKSPLLAKVSELTQIEPPDSSRQELTTVLGDGCLLLMSRGAMPFRASAAPDLVSEWWDRDAGWRHGLGATVVAVASQRARSLAEHALFAFDKSIRSARSAAS